MHEKIGDEEIVGFKLAFHDDIITINSMMSNYISASMAVPLQSRSAR